MKSTLSVTSATLTSPVPAEIAALLCLLSREFLSSNEAACAVELASRVTDWPRLARIAYAKRGLPFVYRHVSALNLLPDDSPLRQAMRERTLILASHWLRFASVQRNLLTKCLTDPDVPHLFFKGISLSRYYKEPALRPFRDIDVLVHKRDARTVIARAQSHGYDVLMNQTSGLKVQSNRDLDALLRYKKDIPLVSPEGVSIELQVDLWHGARFSTTEMLLELAETTTVAGTKYRVMPTAALFVYLCHHHNRHLWSSLNWIADIAALRSAADFNEDDVLHFAERLQLREVVEATLAFDNLCRRRPHGRSAIAHERAAECMRLCVLNLEGDVEVERMLYFREIQPHLDWRVRRDLRETSWRRVWRARLTPSLDQYVERPLPLWLHWVYPIRRMAEGSLDLARRSRNQA